MNDNYKNRCVKVPVILQEVHVKDVHPLLICWRPEHKISKHVSHLLQKVHQLHEDESTDKELRDTQGPTTVSGLRNELREEERHDRPAEQQSEPDNGRPRQAPKPHQCPVHSEEEAIPPYIVQDLGVHGQHADREGPRRDA